MTTGYPISPMKGVPVMSRLLFCLAVLTCCVGTLYGEEKREVEAVVIRVDPEAKKVVVRLKDKDGAEKGRETTLDLKNAKVVSEDGKPIWIPSLEKGTRLIVTHKKGEVMEVK